MRFTTQEDIDRPIDAVFAEVSDFPAFERAAMRQGAEIERTGHEHAEGHGWTVRFKYRGRRRELVSMIERLDTPKGLTTTGRIGGIEGALAVDLSELSRTKTRMRVDLELKPKTIPARLLLQSLRLGKKTLTKRFKSRIRRFARRIERTG